MHYRCAAGVAPLLAFILAGPGCGSPSPTTPTSPAPDGGGFLESADASFGPGGSRGGGDAGSAGSSSDGSASGGGPLVDGGGQGGDAESGSDGGSVAGAITCPAPGSYTKNGGACGTERWDIKTGTDPYTSSVTLAPKSTTIAALVSLPAAGGGATRESPTETTLWELKDVTLAMIKLETDSDYHMVLSDAGHTIIAEIPYPDCAASSAWSCFVSRVRGEVDAKLSVGSPQYPALTVTVRGVGFFDFAHGQTGVAPNAIELHPVLQLCFGQGCTPT